ncbi:hypothetical protein T484DRAFT_1908142, partial [Baffinella frigidus]
MMKASSFKLSAPLPLARAAAPLSPSELQILASNRRILSGTAFHSEEDDSTHEFAFGASQLCDVFATIRANHRRAPEACAALATELHALAEQNPALCEVFFQGKEVGVATHPSTPWDEAMALVRDCTSAVVLERVVDVLVCVVLQVGIGVDRVRALLRRVEPPAWPAFSLTLLRGLCRMVEQDQRAVQAHVSRYFIFDGADSGLLLGGAHRWPWHAGYTLQASVWLDSAAAPAVHLFRMMREDEKKGGEELVMEAAIHDRKVVLVSMHSSGRSIATCPITLPERRWVHIVISHARNGLLRRAEVDVRIDAQQATMHLPYPTDQGGAVRVYLGCSDAAFRTSAPATLPRINQPAVQLAPLRGLVGGARVYPAALTPPQAKALFAAESQGGADPAATYGGPLPSMTAHPDTFPRQLGGGGKGGLPLPLPGPLPLPLPLHLPLPQARADRAVGLGSVSVGGRVGVAGAVDCLGQVPSLLTLLAAASSKPVAQQLPGGSEAFPGADIAVEVLRLIAALARIAAAASPAESASVEGWPGAARLNSALGAILTNAPSELLTPTVLAGVLSVAEAGTFAAGHGRALYAQVGGG